jgi:HEAT repeat protein
MDNLLSFIQQLNLWDSTLVWIILSTAFLFILACALTLMTLYLRISNSRKAKRWKTLEVHWEKRILPILAGDKPFVTIHQHVHKKDQLFFVDFLSRYATRFRGDELKIIIQMAAPYLPILQKRINRHDPERRARAIKTLALLGFQEYIQNIIKALDDPSPLVAMVAARSLVHEKNPDYAKFVIQKLHRFDQWSTSFLTATLAAVGPHIIPALHSTLSDKTTPSRTRTVAVNALQQLNDIESTDIAVEILQSTDDTELIASCLRYIGRIGYTKHIPIVRSFLQHPNFAIRTNATRTIGMLGSPEDWPYLKHALLDESPWVAIQAAEGLRESDAYDILEEIALSDHPRAVFAQQVLEEESK